MKYMLVTAKTSEGLEKLVNFWVREHGWDPLGAAAVITWKMGRKQRFEYSQVLINQTE